MEEERLGEGGWRGEMEEGVMEREGEKGIQRSTGQFKATSEGIQNSVMKTRHLWGDSTKAP